MSAGSPKMDIDIPLAWKLMSIDLGWLENHPPSLSAHMVFAQLATSRPKVSLRSRVPTQTLPCREFVAGDFHGHDLEVAFLGKDFSGRIFLTSTDEAEKPLATAAQDVFAVVGELAPPTTIMKRVGIATRLGGLSRTALQARFASILNMPAVDGEATMQRYSKQRKVQLNYHDGWDADLHFEVLGYPTAEGNHVVDVSCDVVAVDAHGARIPPAWPALLEAAIAGLQLDRK